MPCQGSGITHGDVFLRIWKSPKTLFTRCPLQTCKWMSFYQGQDWEKCLHENGRIGLSRAEIAKRNPQALLF